MKGTKLLFLWYKIPYFVLKLIFRNAWWCHPTHEKVVYLTFDDGPHETITPWVLDLLNKYQAKATFFCVGEMIEKNEKVFQNIILQGHQVGHHNYSHLHAFKNKFDVFMQDVEKTKGLVNSTLYRPPYGKLTWRLYKSIKAKYRIVMWSILSEDYNANKTADYCVKKVLKLVKNGDIIVFHDSVKAKKNLENALPKILEQLHLLGYSFKAIKPI